MIAVSSQDKPVKEKPMNVTIQIPVPPELKQQLEDLAKQNFQTLAATVRQLILKGIKCEQESK